MEAYIFKENGKPDSTLITIEDFNPQGRRTKIQILDSAVVKHAYEYIYENDTVRTERRTYSRGKLHSITKIYYDNAGRESRCVDFDPQGIRTGAGSINTYNKRGDMVESKIYFNARLAVYRKYKYYKNGTNKEINKLRPINTAEKIKYDKNGRQLKSSKFYNMQKEEHLINHNGETTKMTKKTTTYNYSTKLLGLSGAIDLKQGDILVTERYHKMNGLLDYEMQYLNGGFIARKNYKYNLY